MGKKLSWTLAILLVGFECAAVGFVAFHTGGSARDNWLLGLATFGFFAAIVLGGLADF